MTAWTIAVAFAALLGSAGLGGVLKTWLDHKRGKRKQTDDVALALVEKLEKRIDSLEESQESERQRCDAELRILRHRIGGWKQLFYSLLHLFDLPAAQRRNTLEAVRQEMAALEQAERTETGAMLGARQAVREGQA